MRVTIEGTTYQIHEAAALLTIATEEAQSVDLLELADRRAKRIAALARGDAIRRCVAERRRTVHAAFLIARKSGDPRMVDLLAALTGKTDLASTVPMAKEILTEHQEAVNAQET